MDWVLTLSNIGGFQEEHQFTFKEGCNRIYAPNASGKSSLIQAIKLLTPLKDIPLNVLNSNALVGSVNLQNSEGSFQIRIVKTSDGAISPQDTYYLTENQFAEKLAFLTSNHVLIAGADKNDETMIKDWINEVTNLNYYEKAYAICSKLLVKYKMKKEKEQVGLFNQRKQLNILISEEKEKIKQLENDLDEIRSKSEGSTEINELNDQIGKQKSKIENIDEKIEIFNNISEKKKERAEIISKLDKLKEDLEACGNDLKIKKEKIPEIESKIKDIEDQKEIENERLQAFKEKRQKLQIKIELFKETLSSGEEICIHCGNKIAKDVLKKNLKDLDSELYSSKAELQNLTDGITNLEKEKGDLERELDLYRNKLPEKERQISRQIPVVSHKLDLLEEKIQQLTLQVHHLKKADLLEKASRETDAMIVAEKNLTALTSKDENLRKEQEAILNKISFLRDSIKDKESLLNKCDFEIEKLNKYEVLMDRTKLVLKEFQSKIYAIQEDFLDKINQNLDLVLQLLEFPILKSIIINDDLSLTIMRTGTRKGRFDELSNYERKLVAIIIGISAKNAFLPEFPLFVIDEPLDSADDRRFEKTLEYIKQKVRVLIVTKPVFDENTKILTQSNIIFS